MYIYTLGYNRAIGRAYNGAAQPYFQGSSLNRSPRIPQEEHEVFQTAQKAAGKPASKGASETAISGLTKPKKVAVNSFLQGRTISRRSKQKIKDKIFALYRSSGTSKFTFLTLTTIGTCHDRTAQTTLNKFLTSLRSKYGKFLYIWVAERQEETKNIHFHVILSRYFPVAYINSLWVTAQLNSGIVNQKMVNKLKEQCNTTFQDLHRAGDYSRVQKYLNPVDIKAIKSIDGLSCYLTEYITKNNDTFHCQPWHCNREVSKLFTKQLISKRTFAKTSDTRKNRITNRKGKTYVNKTYVGEHCIINTIYNKQHYQRYLHELEQVNKWVLEQSTGAGKLKVDSALLFDEKAFIDLVYSGITSINQN